MEKTATGISDFAVKKFSRLNMHLAVMHKNKNAAEIINGVKICGLK